MSKNQKFVHRIERKGGQSKFVIQIQLGNQGEITAPVVNITAFGRKQIDPDWLAKAMNAMVNTNDPEQWAAMAKTHMDYSELQANQNARLKAQRDELLMTIKRLSQTFLKDKTAKEITDWLRNECNQALDKVKEDSHA